MRVGFVGLGKLGMPVAVAMATKGHDVYAYDIDPDRMRKHHPFREMNRDNSGPFLPELEKSKIKFASLAEVVHRTEIVFVAVPTPHGPEYEGITPLPSGREDFDYSYLKAAIADICKEARDRTVISIISTVLPGTVRREILPFTGPDIEVYYNPQFIAMGNTMNDFLFPEFVLIGSDGGRGETVLKNFWKQTTGDAPIHMVSIESAELAKVAYNTFITQKIVFANSLMEICDKIPQADVDQVSNVLATATRRVVSPAYMRGGLGDGGACHPRDNIAMSYLACALGLSYNPFEAVMRAREEQARHIARVMCEYDLPKVIVGYNYKPSSDLVTGSCSLLIKNLLVASGVEVSDDIPSGPCVVLIGSNEKKHADLPVAQGSVIIDPWRISRNKHGVTIRRLGERHIPVQRPHQNLSEGTVAA